MQLDGWKILEDKQVISVICNQWGDTGKGKFVDIFAQWADIIARGTGGPNAGHTVKIGSSKYVFHLLPSGILHDKDGKVCMIGNNVLVDLKSLCAEIAVLEKHKLSYKNLMISKDATLILPQHILTDKAKYQSLKDGGIGTTGRGIGPAYEDKIGRRDIKLSDLFSEELFAKKIDKSLGCYPGLDIDAVELVKEQMRCFQKIRPYVKDTVRYINDAYAGGKKILLEGAQGLLLSIEYGTGPFVTASDPSKCGTASGVGLDAGKIDLTLGIVKAPYMTRVGNGPFPTEYGGKISEDYCSQGLSHDKDFELAKYPDYAGLISSADEFIQGIAIRLEGDEYGATTKRPRRTGWLDLVALRHAVQFNGTDMILTKVDVMSRAEKIRLCIGYEYAGKERDTPYGRLRKGMVLDYFPKEEYILRDVKPVYRDFSGWKKDISSVREYDRLPQELKVMIGFIEEFCLADVRIVSVGPARDETIFRH